MAAGGSAGRERLQRSRVLDGKERADGEMESREDKCGRRGRQSLKERAREGEGKGVEMGGCFSL